MKNWLSRWKRGFGQKGLSLPPAPPEVLFPRGASLNSRNGQMAAYQGWVYAAVNAIARRIAGMPLRLYLRDENGRGAEITSHPLLEILAAPNPLFTGRQMRSLLVTHLELTGMAFLLVVRNRLDEPAELWPLSPGDLVEIKAGRDTARPIEAFVFQNGEGRATNHPPEDILYFRHPGPNSLIYGASPIEAMAHAYDIDLAVRVYQRSFFKNSARPEVVLETDQRLTREEAGRILTRWNQKHQGLAQAFTPTILEGGLRVKPLTFPAKDFEFATLAGWTRDNILAAYGVPAGKLGLVEDVNRANAEGIEITFNSECIRPRLDLLEDVLQSFLAPAFGNDLILAHDNPIPADRAQLHAQAMDELDRGAITINEFRAAKGLAPAAWGDEPRTYNNLMPQMQAPSKSIEPAGGKMKQLKENLSRAWPRLEARFAGWSSARVAEELEAKPALLDALIPPGLEPEMENTLRRRLAECLKQGLDLEQAVSRLEPEAHKES